MITNDLSAIDRLAERIGVQTTESVSINDAVGRVSREPILADRDSPAADVSAMDGYALGINAALSGNILRVTGLSRPGAPPPPCPADDAAIQIFTGAVVPSGCNAVVRREDVREIARTNESIIEEIQLGDIQFASGMNIRFQGENAAKDSIVIDDGALLRPGHIAAAVNFGYANLQVTRRIRVRILVTGDELCDVGEQVQAWQLRDSNGPTLNAILSSRPWIDIEQVNRAPDDFDMLAREIRESLEAVDAIILTGGVSMGDFDFVPAAVKRAGAEPVFHKLPIRPGKPIFGASGPVGQLVLGLPGNPVSAAVGAVRFAIPLLSKMAGCHAWMPPHPRITLEDHGEKTLPLTWFRLVQLQSNGACNPVRTLGSGDLVSLATSEGFVEVPAGETGPGPWPFWSWSV